MVEQRTDIPRASGLFCTLDATKEHPERYATIIGGAAPLPLNKAQALALFRIMLSHLAQIAGDELHQESLLEQGDLIQRLNFSMDLLGSWSDHDLQDRQVLKEALEQYSLVYDMQAELALQVAEWETTLRREYERMESAASNIEVDLEDLADEEEDDLEDETTEELNCVPVALPLLYDNNFKACGIAPDRYESSLSISDCGAGATIKANCYFHTHGKSRYLFSEFPQGS